jgi:hypothetical protein
MLITLCFSVGKGFAVGELALLSAGHRSPHTFKAVGRCVIPLLPTIAD